MKDERTINSVSIDELGQLYALYSDDDLYTFSEDIDTLYQFYNQLNGKITQVDVTNPFKLLLFYRDQNKVVFLDNTLSFMEDMSIDAGHYPDVAMVSTSRDDKLWIYEVATQRIYKLNKDGSELFSGHPITDFVDPISTVDQLMERNNRLYLRSGMRVIILDIYAHFQRELKVSTRQDIFINEDKILYVDLYGKIMKLQPPFYSPEAITKDRIAALDKDQRIVIGNNKYYIISGNELIAVQ